MKAQLQGSTMGTPTCDLQVGTGALQVGDKWDVAVAHEEKAIRRLCIRYICTFS